MTIIINHPEQFKFWYHNHLADFGLPANDDSPLRLEWRKR